MIASDASLHLTGLRDLDLGPGFRLDDFAAEALADSRGLASLRRLDCGHASEPAIDRLRSGRGDRVPLRRRNP